MHYLKSEGCFALQTVLSFIGLLKTNDKKYLSKDVIMKAGFRKHVQNLQRTGLSIM